MQIKKKVKLFYEGKIYKELSVNCLAKAIEFMNAETQMIPLYKRYLIHFEVPSFARQNENNP